MAAAPRSHDLGLGEAAKRGDARAVTAALAAGIGADALPSQWSSEDEMRAIHHAAAGNHAEVAKLLAGAGADCDRRHRGGYAPLHYAAFFRHHEVAAVLVGAGADPNAPDDDGRTACSHARDKKDDAMLEILLGGRSGRA